MLLLCNCFAWVGPAIDRRKNEFMVNGIRLRDEESGEDFSVGLKVI